MFSPYHQFNNCKKLDSCINQLFSISCVSQTTYDRYYHYHRALEQKLKGARYNLDELKELIENTSVTSASENFKNFLFQANLYIDGFFYNAGSALDILAREVLTIFELCPDGNVYYIDAHDIINSNHPSDPILTRLEIPTWKEEFSNYRNSSTHEVLLSTTADFSLEMSPRGTTEKIKLPLPDDPRVLPTGRTYNKHPNALEYCITSFKRLLRHINAIYGDIYNKATTKGSLPLP